MQRRQALKKIAWGVALTGILPYCSGEPLPVFKNLEISRNSLRNMDAFLGRLLPVPEAYVLPEASLDFVLYMVDDCYKKEDIQIFQTGMDAFFTTAQNKKTGDFHSWSVEKQSAELQDLISKQDTPEAILFFINSSKNLLVRQFTSSERFMKDELSFEFAPGYYNGCAPI